MSDKLKLDPCPFCGNNEIDYRFPSARTIEIKCSCGIRYIQKHLRLTREQLLVKMVERWNTRLKFEEEYKLVCSKLREEVEARKLGLGGERLEDLIIKYVFKLEEEKKKYENLLDSILNVLTENASEVVKKLSGK